MPSTAVITRDQREKLIDLAKQDASFRDLLKSDWTKALTRAGIDPATVKDRVLRQTDLAPFKGGASTAGIEITIEIMSAAKEERINLNDIVVFDQKKTK